MAENHLPMGQFVAENIVGMTATNGIPFRHSVSTGEIVKITPRAVIGSLFLNSTPPIHNRLDIRVLHAIELCKLIQSRENRTRNEDIAPTGAENIQSFIVRTAQDFCGNLVTHSTKTPQICDSFVHTGITNLVAAHALLGNCMIITNRIAELLFVFTVAFLLALCYTKHIPS